MASVGLARTVLFAGVSKEENFVVTTKLEMAELEEVHFWLQMQSVAVGRIATRTVERTAETVAGTTKWEIADLQWLTVVEGRSRKVVRLSAGRREERLIVGLDLRLVAVKLHAVLVVENIVVAGGLRMDVGGNWSGYVDPLVPAGTCGSVGCLLRFPSVQDETTGDGNEAPRGDCVGMYTGKENLY
jgi:hypothetical protein